MSTEKTIATLAAFTLIGGSSLMLFGCPHYNVWQQGMVGKAELSKAESNRQIATLEAAAKNESAKMLAEAEITRAKGVAEANKIIGTSLQNNDAYLRYLWILGLQDSNGETIYVPTEANLPIMEAGRFMKQTTASVVAENIP